MVERKCRFCGSEELIHDPVAGTYTCRNCGAVVDEMVIDEGYIEYSHILSMEGRSRVAVRGGMTSEQIVAWSIHQLVMKLVKPVYEVDRERNAMMYQAVYNLVNRVVRRNKRLWLFVRDPEAFARILVESIDSNPTFEDREMLQAVVAIKYKLILDEFSEEYDTDSVLRCILDSLEPSHIDAVKILMYIPYAILVKKIRIYSRCTYLRIMKHGMSGNLAVRLLRGIANDCCTGQF